MDGVEKAEVERNERFSRETMRKEAKQAADGLNFGNIDELRSLKQAPPPIAQLVARCVSTLIAGDDIGDDEAFQAEQQALSARSASPTPTAPTAPTSARGRQQAASERPTADSDDVDDYPDL